MLLHSTVSFAPDRTHLVLRAALGGMRRASHAVQLRPRPPAHSRTPRCGVVMSALKTPAHSRTPRCGVVMSALKTPAHSRTPRCGVVMSALKMRHHSAERPPWARSRLSPAKPSMSAPHLKQLGVGGKAKRIPPLACCRCSLACGNSSPVPSEPSVAGRATLHLPALQRWD
jgi:hypothetical protein